MKRAQKQLSLSRETVSNLSNESLRQAAGGEQTYGCPVLVATWGCPTLVATWGCPTRVTGH